MAIPTDRPAANKRRPLLLWACGGCALLAVCVVLFLVVDGVYWYLKVGAPLGAAEDGAPQPTLAPADLQAEWALLPAGSASDGELVFRGQSGCSACHSLEPGVTVVGPSLAGVAQRAATRKPDLDAELYLYESVAYPGAYVVGGFPPNTMPRDFGTRLSQQELADVVAFLLTK